MKTTGTLASLYMVGAVWATINLTVANLRGENSQIEQVSSEEMAQAFSSLAVFAIAFELAEPAYLVRSNAAKIYARKESYNSQVWVTFKNGMVFRWSHGHVFSFQRFSEPRASERGIMTNERISAAVKQFRKGATSLGWSVEKLYADQDPKTNSQANEIFWPSPSFEKTSVSLKLASEKPFINEIFILNYSLWDRRSPPKPRQYLYRSGEKCSGAISNSLEKMRIAITELSIKLHLPAIDASLGKVATWSLSPRQKAFDHRIDGELLLKSGHRFEFEEDRIVEYDAPDKFFVLGDEIDLHKFFGQPTLSEPAAIERVRQNVSDLGFRPRRSWWAKDPVVSRPNISPAKIPHLHFSWRDIEQGVLREEIQVEINTEDGIIRSLKIRLLD